MKVGKEREKKRLEKGKKTQVHGYHLLLSITRYIMQFKPKGNNQHLFLSSLVLDMKKPCAYSIGNFHQQALAVPHHLGLEPSRV